MSDDDNAKIVRRHKFFSFFRPSVYPPRMAPIGAKLWENAFQMIPNVSFSDTEKKIGRFFSNENWYSKFRFQETGVLEEPDAFERHWQIPRKKLLPEVGLLLGRLPWRRGKRLNLCRKSWLSTENDFNRKKIGRFFSKKIDTRNFVFKKLAIWRSQTLLSVTGRFVVKSYCPKWVYF